MSHTVNDKNVPETNCLLPPFDYSKYKGSTGMSTKIWGPKAWDFLFTSIMGQYPFILDERQLEHRNIKNAFESMLSNLTYIMPCSYCRTSYEAFYKELDIHPYLVGRIELMYWLYLMKEKVNRKLTSQEEQAKLNSDNKVVFQTKESPLFVEVLDKYEHIRVKPLQAFGKNRNCKKNSSRIVAKKTKKTKKRSTIVKKTRTKKRKQQKRL
jgi:hypothetical protein